MDERRMGKEQRDEQVMGLQRALHYDRYLLVCDSSNPYDSLLYSQNVNGLNQLSLIQNEPI